jgi:hypothetical protein
MVRNTYDETFITKGCLQVVPSTDTHGPVSEQPFIT